jgi:hypothetical protein
MPSVSIFQTQNWFFSSFCREYAKKVCCLGLTSLIGLPASHIPGEALERIFKSTLELLVAYKDQVAGAVYSCLL